MRRAQTERGAKAAPHLGSARRGERYPVWAHAGAVGAARRLRCGARIARAAAMPLASGAPAPLHHGFSPVRRLRRWTPPCAAGLAGRAGPGGPAARQARPVHWTVRVRARLLAAPEIAHPGYRPPRNTTELFVDQYLGASGKAVVGCASAATLCGAEHRRARGRARAARVSTSDSRRLFEHSERSERSEFRRGPCDRGAQGSRPAGPTAVHERRRMPGLGFASFGSREMSAATDLTAHARDCFLRACELDVTVRKPGNVSVASTGHRMHAEQFITNARAAAAGLFERGAPVGERIERAVSATWAAVGCNTNLGITLLIAPLAAA